MARTTASAFEGKVADAYAEGGVDGVRDGGGGGPLRGLAGAERRLVAVDEVHVDLGRRGEPQDRVALPVVAGDPRRSKRTRSIVVQLVD